MYGEKEKPIYCLFYNYLKYMTIMKRNEFFKKAALGFGSMVLAPSLIKAFPVKNTFYESNSKIIRNNEGKKINVIGDNMTVKLTGTDTSGQFGLIEENNDPGVGIPLHVHKNEDEIFKVIEGEVEFELGDEKKILLKGDLAFCPRGIPHSWKVVGSQKSKVDLSFFPAGLEILFEELSKLPAGPPDFAMVAEICGKYGIKFL